MTQDLKDKALDALAKATVEGNKVRLPAEDIDTEVWTIVKDALVAVGGQYNKRTKLFVFPGNADDARDNALDHLKSQEVEKFDALVLYDGPEVIEPEVEEETQAKKDPDTLTFKKEKRTLRYDFTASEIHEHALRLAEENRKFATVEQEQSSMAAQYGAKKKVIKATIDELSHLITNGYEHRDVECEVHFNKPEPGKKTVIRLDTNSATVEKMEPWEYNLWNQPADSFVETDL